MKLSAPRISAFFALALISVGCTSALESTGVATSIGSLLPVTYNCSYFDNNRYDDLATCQALTGATCQSETDSFPSGAMTTCYFPPVGFQTCQVSPPTWNWIYSSSPWCDTGLKDSATVEIYKQSRNLIGCSSPICTCASDPVLTVYCAGDESYTDQDLGAPNGTIGCASYPANPVATPDPSATPNPSPTPTPTPIPMCQ